MARVRTESFNFIFFQRLHTINPIYLFCFKNFHSFKSYNICHRWRRVVLNYSTTFLRKSGTAITKRDEDLFLECYDFGRSTYKEVSGFLNNGAMHIIRKFVSNHLPIINKLHEHRNTANMD